MDLPIGGNSVVATQSPPPSDDVEAVEAMPSQVTKEHVATTQEEKSGTAAASSRFLSDVSFCGAASGEYYPMGSLEMEASESTQQSISINRLRNTPIGLGGRLDDEWSPYHLSESILVQICYLAIFSMAGTLLRVVLAQLFGEECANPGTVGWLAAGSPLCITKNGETAAQEGGIIFADLPANLLGSFIMGLLQQGTVLGLPIDMPLAFLNPQHVLQTMPILHVALRTGFCGSLTTYSSWNSEMIVMMFGTGREQYTVLNQLIRALFGYLIGVETALGSFEFGKTVAKWCNHVVNPLLSAEAVASEQRSAEGVYLNRHLPDLERRFLPDLPMEHYGEHNYEAHAMECLERWRHSTVEARRVGHALLPTLIEIESALLVHGFEIQLETDSMARANHWDVDALREWARHKRSITTATEGEDGQRQPLVNHDGVEHPHPFFTLSFAGYTVAVVSVGLLLCLLMLNGQTSFQTTDRTTCYAMLFSPLGAILRWQLGQHLNGKWTTFSWFPVGTWAANFLASCLSIAMIATELKISADHPGFWIVGTVRAVRVGFSGSLSTVSTFVAEVSGLKKKDRAYNYVMITLTSTCVVGSAIYGLILFA